MTQYLPHPPSEGRWLVTVRYNLRTQGRMKHGGVVGGVIEDNTSTEGEFDRRSSGQVRLDGMAVSGNLGGAASTFVQLRLDNRQKMVKLVIWKVVRIGRTMARWESIVQPVEEICCWSETPTDARSRPRFVRTSGVSNLKRVMYETCGAGRGNDFSALAAKFTRFCRFKLWGKGVCCL